MEVEQDKQQEKVKKEEEQQKEENQGQEQQGQEVDKSEVDREELEKLKRENEELKQKHQNYQQQYNYQSSIAHSQELDETHYEQAANAFASMSDTEYEEKWAEKYQGLSKFQVVSEMRNQARDFRNQKLQAKITVRDYVDDVISKNSRLSKLKNDIKTYLDKLPLREKTDEKNLERHIKDAERWALGGYRNNKTQNTNLGASNMENRVTPNMDIQKQDKDDEFKEFSEYRGKYNQDRVIKVRNEKLADGVVNIVQSDSEKIDFSRNR